MKINPLPGFFHLLFTAKHHLTRLDVGSSLRQIPLNAIFTIFFIMLLLWTFMMSFAGLKNGIGYFAVIATLIFLWIAVENMVALTILTIILWVAICGFADLRSAQVYAAFVAIYFSVWASVKYFLPDDEVKYE